MLAKSHTLHARVIAFHMHTCLDVPYIKCFFFFFYLLVLLLLLCALFVLQKEMCVAFCFRYYASDADENGSSQTQHVHAHIVIVMLP